LGHVCGDLPEKEKGVFHSDRGTLCASAHITAFAAANGLTRTSHAHHLKAEEARNQPAFTEVDRSYRSYRRIDGPDPSNRSVDDVDVDDLVTSGQSSVAQDEPQRPSRSSTPSIWPAKSGLASTPSPLRSAVTLRVGDGTRDGRVISGIRSRPEIHAGFVNGTVSLVARK
jgi:hypothetical protein